jgi:hypothetical protein
MRKLRVHWGAMVWDRSQANNRMKAGIDTS